MKLILTIIIFLSAILGLSVLGNSNRFSYSYDDETEVVEQPSALWRMASFDGVHYLSIARYGYQSGYQTAFFPLYPTLIFILSFVTHNFLISGFIISLISFFLILYLLKKLFGGLAIYSLVFFPTAFFLLCIYSDSLFLFLSLFSFYLYRKDRLTATSIVIALATATRIYGFLLIPFFLLLAFKDKKKFTKKQLAVMPLGLISYMIYLTFTFADPLAFFHNLGAWQKNNLVLPLQTVYRYLKILFTVSPSTPTYFVALLELTIFVLVVSINLFILLSKNYPFALLVFLGWLVPSMTGTLQSFPRYALALFPIFGYIQSSRYRLLILLLGGITEGLLLYAFTSGIFVS